MGVYNCVSSEVRLSSTNKVKLSRNSPWRSIGVFPVRYEHHLHIKKVKLSPVTRRGGLELSEVEAPTSSRQSAHR
jgi:hypothetical protein